MCRWRLAVEQEDWQLHLSGVLEPLPLLMPSFS
jgi:hypothetical protein